MAVVTLALGIGANTALFSVISAVLLRPLPYPDADRLVRLWSTGQKHPLPRYASALPDHRVWRSENRTFEDIGAYIWAPLSFSVASPENTRRFRFVDQLGRLKPRITVPQAQADLSRIAEGVAREFPNVNAGLGVALERWQDSMVASVRPTLWLMLGAVGFVLLIACANVANLFLVLALVGLYGVLAYMVGQRRRELGLRAALGATSADLLLLVMAQGLGMTAVGVGIGLLLASALTRLMSAQLFQVSAVDPGIYMTVSLTLIVVAGLACGVPALRATRVDPAAALRSS